MVVGLPPGVGIGVAIAGRAMPRMRPMRSSAEPMAAPVLPADTIADARPSRTASAARTSDESFIVRTLDPGSASIGITSEASMTSRPPVSPNSSGRPTSTTGIPNSSAARRAPATISPGARSPPMASTATGSMAPASAERSDRPTAPSPILTQFARSGYRPQGSSSFRPFDTHKGSIVTRRTLGDRATISRQYTPAMQPRWPAGRRTSRSWRTRGGDA